MALLLEERQESLAELGRRAHGGHCRSAAEAPQEKRTYARTLCASSAPGARCRYRHRLRCLPAWSLVGRGRRRAGAWFGSHQPSASHAAAPRVVPLVEASAAVPMRATPLAPEHLFTGDRAPATHVHAEALPAVGDRRRRGIGARRSGRGTPTSGAVASTDEDHDGAARADEARADDIVTVDQSVPRVPLVREGLRAGER